MSNACTVNQFSQLCIASLKMCAYSSETKTVTGTETGLWLFNSPAWDYPGLLRPVITPPPSCSTCSVHWFRWEICGGHRGVHIAPRYNYWTLGLQCTDFTAAQLPLSRMSTWSLVLNTLLTSHDSGWFDWHNGPTAATHRSPQYASTHRAHYHHSLDLTQFIC